MRTETKNVALQILITVSMFSLAFYTLTQTSLYDNLMLQLQTLCTRTNFLIGYESLFPILLTILLYGVIVLMGIFGGKSKLNLVYNLSLLLYFPAALAFSSVDWSAVIGIPIPLESYMTFSQVLLVGIALITCRLFLNNLSQINEKKAEFLRRGENEVDDIHGKMIVCTSTVLGLAVATSITAMMVLAIGEPTASAFLATVPYAQILFGLGSTFTLVAILYYYLKQKLPMKTEQTK